MAGEINRIYYLDTMRSILMMLGVVLHSAQVFNPKQTWLISSSNTTWLASHLVEVIHTFRMPAFFIISGFFCMLTLGRSTPNQFIRTRLKRILVPLVSTAITLNTLQAIILTQSGWYQFDLGSYLETGEWVSHLWFLNNLIVYFLLMFGLFKLLKLLAKESLVLDLDFTLSIPPEVLLLLLPVVSIFIHMLNRAGFPLYSSFYGVFNTYSLLSYAPYFIFGIFMYASKDLLMKFNKINPLYLITLFIVSEVMLSNKYLSSIPEMFHAVTIVYFDSLKIWALVAMVFYVFYNFTNYKSVTFNFLSDSSYTVYLFHQIAVVSFGLILIHLGVSGLMGLLLLVTITTTVTLLIHRYCIMRVPRLRLLFNGK